MPKKIMFYWEIKFNGSKKDSWALSDNNSEWMPLNQSEVKQYIREELQKARVPRNTVIKQVQELPELPADLHSRIEIVEKEKNGTYGTYYLVRFKRGRKPKGFSRYIGAWSVEDGCVHSSIDSVFLRRRGIGFRVYASLLRQHHELRTSYFSASVQARLVWKKLSTYCPHTKDFWRGSLTVEWDASLESLTYPIV